MIKLTCPSCGGMLELPDNLDVAHCMYCGTKILLEQPETPKENQALGRYKELCKIALESKNYNEAIKYSNSILEIDPRDVDAWIDKATATCWLTNGLNNRYDEAMGYLKRAAQLAPANRRIFEVRDELTHLQASWYSLLGAKKIEHAAQIVNIYKKISADVAAKKSQKEFTSAMECFLNASKYAPDDLNILIIIKTCSQANQSIKWSQAVYDKIETLEHLQARKEAEESLPKLRETFTKLRAELIKLNTDKGAFRGLKTLEIEGKLKSIMAKIASKEKVLAYEKPKVHYDW